MAGQSVSIEETEQIGRFSFHLRGKLYEGEEVEAAKYEELVKAAVTDPDEGTVDMNLLANLIAIETVKVNGKPIDAASWGREKFPVVNRIRTEVRRLHFIELETDEEKAERKKAEAAAEASAKKAAKGPGLPNS